VRAPVSAHRPGAPRGIMSAIDFFMDIQRQPDPKGDRVHAELSGKFRPYKTY
jgi:cyanate lyase